MEYKDIIFTVATLVGPIASTLIAIYYTRYSDEKRRTQDRQVEIFRNLMKTRGVRLHPDHVNSLNLIQTDFKNDSEVMSTWKEYINFLYRSIPANATDNFRHTEEGEMLFSNLLVAIGKALGITLNSTEIKHFQYAPNGWQTDENDQRHVRKLLMNVLQGLSPLAIKQASTTEYIAGVFPPPPSQ